MTIVRRIATLLLAAVAAGTSACGPRVDSVVRVESAAPDLGPGLRYEPETKDCCAGRVHRTRGTGYYPHNDQMQGGYFDRRGKKLVTLQDYVEGKSKYAALAMDKAILPYGTLVCIPHLNEKYGKSIQFRVVDTGGAFKRKGVTRMDVCTRSKAHTQDKAINREFDFVVCEDQPYQVR